jgi:hypothetical protein
MPPQLYNKNTNGFYKNKEEMISLRKNRDNINQKLKYWRTTYNYDVTEKDYEEFNKHASNIKHIFNIHDWFCNYSIGDKIPEEYHNIFFSKQRYILRALLSQSYIKTLKKIDESNQIKINEDIDPDKKYIMEFN